MFHIVNDKARCYRKLNYWKLINALRNTQNRIVIDDIMVINIAIVPLMRKVCLKTKQFLSRIMLILTKTLGIMFLKTL